MDAAKDSSRYEGLFTEDAYLRGTLARYSHPPPICPQAIWAAQAEPPPPSYILPLPPCGAGHLSLR
jgi:hypothetical protein